MSPATSWNLTSKTWRISSPDTSIAKEEIFQEVLIIHPYSTKKTSHQFLQTLRLQSATSIWSYIFFLRKTTKTAICSIDTSVSLGKKENSGKLITSVPEKSTLRTKENLTSATVSKIENVVSISTPFKRSSYRNWSSGRSKLHHFRRVLRIIHRSRVHRL